jgi:hypothetical protein
MTIDFECSSSELQAYEERCFCSCYCGNRARVIYVTSQMIHPNIIITISISCRGHLQSRAQETVFGGTV